MEKIELQLLNNIGELEKLNLKVEELSEQWGLAPRTIFNLNLVLEELVTNVIFYAFRDGQEHEFLVEFVKEDNELIIRIIDDGIEFDPTASDVPDDINKPIEERQIGGLGIHFVKNITDLFTYQRADGKNIITLKMNVSNNQ
jgi:serine/threonine-protein kinase RsbW